MSKAYDRGRSVTDPSWSLLRAIERLLTWTLLMLFSAVAWIAAISLLVWFFRCVWS